MRVEGGEGGGGLGGLQATGCVMCCQNIWVTKSCPATQTIEAKTGSPGKVSFKHPTCDPFQVCYDPPEEMTSGIRQDGQEIDFLPPFCHFSDLRFTDAATASSIFHA